MSPSFIELPEPVARIADLMSTFRPTWALCGGWAVDAWLGRQTREHGDVDIAVFQDDQGALFDHLAHWNLIAHDPNVPGDSAEPWDGRPLDLPAHIHARPPGARNLEALHAWVPAGRPPRDGLNLEILLSDRRGDDWLLSRVPDISLPVDRSVRHGPAGLPTVVPEVLLFYKATAYFGVKDVKDRPQDADDFLALLPHLTDTQRDWLRQAISRVHPGHPWLPPLPL